MKRTASIGWLLACGLVAVACGDDAATGGGGGGNGGEGPTGGASVGGGGADGGAGGEGGQGGAGGGACSDGIEVAAADLETESVQELRTFFGVDTGFDGGEVYFADAASSIDQCPAYDQSSVVYISPIDEALLPIELQGQDLSVKFVWGLNGLRFITLGPDERDEPMPDGYLRVTPIEACTVLDANLTEAERQAYVDAVEAAHPETPISHLSEIGVLCWGGMGPVDGPPEQEIVDGDDAELHAQVRALADDVRGDPEIGTIEWSGYVWGFPSVFEVGQSIEEATFHPECLRTATRELLEDGTHFASLPSFPEPLGEGWLPNDACE